MKRVLVVDDDPHLLDMAALILSTFSYDVSTATNGVEAFEQIRQTAPDVVLLDLMMPVMDGWAFLEAAQANGVASQVPIAVMSARHDAGRVLQMGARAVIKKPFDVSELVAVVEEVS
jgi:two-component system, chemotaxis family, chemotaxis protein CheY